MKPINIRQFDFERISNGSYRVTFHCPKRGDSWIATIREMPLIDLTKNAETPKQKDLRHLRDRVKLEGYHYSSKGKRIE